MGANTRENPYVGPRAFRIADQKMFAGRDRDILALYRQLVADRIVLLFSPSGAGKSSLVNAGLLPRMSDKGFKVFPVVRVNHPLPNGLEEDSKANRYVMSVLQSLEVDRIDRKQVPSAEHIQAGEQAFSTKQLAALSIDAYLTERLCPEGASADEEEESIEPRSLLIFDQFEEILTIDPNDREGKQKFFTQLGEALQSSRRWALFVVREDYVAALEPYRRFLPTRLAQTYRLDLLDDRSAMEAIRKPASLKGMKYTDAAAQHLVDELRKVRIQTPSGEWDPEPQLGRYVEPVQLQVVCYRLWGKVDEDDTITEEEVSQLGSVDDSLAEFYAEKVAETEEKIGVSQKDIRTWFDTKLITPTNIRSQVMWEKDESGDLSNEAILYLEKTHLIRRESRRGIMWLELAHDRLIRPIRENNQKWFKDNLSPLQHHAMLWAAEGEPERLLLRDDELAVAEAWAKDQKLSSNEQKFFDACIDLREHRQAEASKREAEALSEKNKELAHINDRLRIRNRVALMTAVAAVILAGLAVWAGISAFNFWGEAEQKADAARRSEVNAQRSADAATAAQKEAEDARKTAETASLFSKAKQLAAQSIVFADTEPKRAILLALEALNTTQRARQVTLPVAEEALRTALGSQSGLLLSGHNGQIKSVAASADEHWLATADNRGHVRIWDLTSTVPSNSKWVLRDMEGIPITNILFSPEGDYLVASGDGGYIFVWNMGEYVAPEPFLLSVSTLNANSDEQVQVSAMAFSPDGGWLAAGASNGTLNLYDMKAYAEASELQPIVLLSSGVKQINVLKFSPDSTRLAAGSEDYLVRLWSVNKPNNTPASAFLSGSVSSLDFSPDGAYLAIGADQIIHLWNVKAPANTPDTYQKTASRITVLAFDPAESTDSNGSNQQQLFVGHANGSLEVWRGRGNTFAIPPNVIDVIDSEITHFSFSPDGHWFLTGSKDRLARLFDATDLDSPPRILHRFGDSITSAVISPNGTWISASSDSNEARLWNLKAGFDTAEPLSLPGRVFAVNSDANILVTASSNDRLPPVLVWNFGDLDALEKISSEISTGDSEGVLMNTLAISPDGGWLAACDASGNVRLKDLQDTDATLNILKGGSSDQGESCQRAEFSPDGQYLIAVVGNYEAAQADYDKQKGVIKVWDLSKTDFAGSNPQILDGHKGYITALAFSADRKWMATGSDRDGTALLWDLEKLSGGEPVLSISGHTGWVSTVAFSPDGQWLATGDDNGDIRFQSLMDQKKTPILMHGHDSWVNVVTFSPDSKYLASGSSDGTIRVWLIQQDGIDPKAFTFRGHEGPIWDLAFSPDSNRFASASSDNTVRLWNWADRSRDAVVLRGYGDTVTQVDFTEDGGWLVTASIDGTTRLWHMGLDRLQKLACQVAGRNLTEKEWDQFINPGGGRDQYIEAGKTCPDYELSYNEESEAYVSQDAPTANAFLIPTTGGGGAPPPQACSVNAGVPVNITFTNKSEREVEVYWIDYNCELIFYATLLPNESYVQGTYQTHPWRFLDAETGEMLREDFVAGTSDQEVTIP